jgi:hypothetical protein
MRRACLFLVLAILSGCVRHYIRPQFDPEEAQFRGIASALLEHDEVNVLFVHGMCTHTVSEWIDRDWEPEIKRTLAAELQSQTEKAAIKGDSPPARLIERSYQIGNKKLNAKFLLWSDITTPIKQNSVKYDDPPPAGEFRWRRAWLNAKLKKQLVNDCLSDPMIYAGAAGDVIKSQIEQRICEAFSLGYDSASRTCTEGGNPSRLPPTSFVVTESLSSKLIMDAVTQLVNGTTTARAFHEAIAEVPQIFMLANQLPLLGLADPQSSKKALQDKSGDGSATADEELTEFIDAIRKSRTVKRGSVPLDGESTFALIAFTDPNDLLSYRLRPRQDANVINVIASNAGTLLGFVAAMPTTAHQGYSKNPRVMKLVLCGHQATDDCEAVRQRASVN